MNDWNIAAKSAPYHVGHMHTVRRTARDRSQINRVLPSGEATQTPARPLQDPNDEAVSVADQGGPKLETPSILQVKILSMLREQAEILESGPIVDGDALSRAEASDIRDWPGEANPPDGSAPRNSEGQMAYDGAMQWAAATLPTVTTDLRNAV